MDHHERVGGKGQRHRAPGEGAAVEEHAGAGHAAGGRELVHEAAVHADVRVLGPLADPGQLERRDRGRVGSERPGRGELEGRRRREARRAGERRGQDPAEAAGRDAGLGERPRRPGDVRGHAAGTRADGVEVERRALVRGVAHQLDPPVGGRHEGDPDLEVDRRRQDEAQVVVGVLADQVDPAGRAGDADLPRIQRGGRLQLDEPIAEPPRVELRGVGDGRVRGSGHGRPRPAALTPGPPRWARPRTRDARRGRRRGRRGAGPRSPRAACR